MGTKMIALRTGKKPDEKKQLYKILEKLPTPPKKMNLNKDQRYWWYWFGKEFLATRKLTQADLMHLQSAAIWMDARAKAIERINSLGYDDGLVQTFRSGATNISAHVTILEKADKHLSDVSAHFGLSIKDRVRLKQTQENPKQTSLFEEFEKMKSTGN